MSGSPDRDKLFALLRAEVLAVSAAAPAGAGRAELARAGLVYEVNRVLYDTVKMTFADGGHADTAERTSLGGVSDAALAHQDAMLGFTGLNL